ncbi:hypothetical protein NEOLEDRAFT_1055446 [Neolentinus lepideus HHB14362 ss-1]|uniref:Uncharacterized protein n=1 Tax=Neolentinus lepideus HHB14362 ss-1 TaxID=1314782 RepID=A0A165VLQ0_9AGAM|nr:hypothetical protein NEOLEDRAFT_1055446 [Neolentinus lepideus HHB14362 ss-1]
MKSQAGITNLAIAQPNELAITGVLHLTIKDKLTHHPFFIVGKCQFSSVTHGDRSRQVSLAPLDLTWPRLAANIGAAFGKKKLFVTTFYNGITFSTFMQARTPATTPQSSPQRGLKTYTSRKAPKEYTFPAGLPYDTDIPVYDGRKTFQLKGFNKLPSFPGEIPVGSAILIIFTAQTYSGKRLPSTVKGLTTSLGFKALAAVVLHDAELDSEARDDAKSDENGPLGVETDVYSSAMSNAADSEPEVF